MHLLVDVRVHLVEDVSSLAVAKDRILASQVDQHGHAQLAGKRAVALMVNILNAPTDRRAG
jgi:hypothetical protein